MSLTNPGTLGTVQSVPRLMPGQGAIIGVGSLGYPAGFEAADPRALAELGLGKVVTLDLDLRPPHHPGRRVGHVPQATSPSASRASTASTTRSSRSMGVPYEPSRWRKDRNAVVDSMERRTSKR